MTLTKLPVGERPLSRPPLREHPGHGAARVSGSNRRHTCHPAGRALLLLTLAGGIACASCSELQTEQKTARQQAKQQWNDVRGKIKYQIAAESFSRGQLDVAQQQLDEVLAIAPNLPEAGVLQARILLERGEVASARTALQSAIMNGANGPESDYLTGVIAQRYGQFDDALLAYRRAAERDPRNAHYVAAVAETLVALDAPAEALALIESRWTDFEHNATLRGTAGQIYLLLGQYEKAADAYRDAVRIAPEDKTFKAQLGLALSLAGRNTETIAVLEPLCAEGARSGETPGYLLTALGRAYLETDRCDEAKSTLRTATQVSPESLSAWSWLARAALTCGDLGTAYEAALKAAELGKGAPEPLILLGYICIRQGNGPAAVRALEEALEKQPGDAMTLYLLSQARRTKAPKALAPAGSARSEARG